MRHELTPVVLQASNKGILRLSYRIPFLSFIKILHLLCSCQCTIFITFISLVHIAPFSLNTLPNQISDWKLYSCTCQWIIFHVFLLLVHFAPVLFFNFFYKGWVGGKRWRWKSEVWEMLNWVWDDDVAEAVCDEEVMMVRESLSCASSSLKTLDCNPLLPGSCFPPLALFSTFLRLNFLPPFWYNSTPRNLWKMIFKKEVSIFILFFVCSEGSEYGPRI